MVEIGIEIIHRLFTRWLVEGSGRLVNDFRTAVSIDVGTMGIQVEFVQIQDRQLIPGCLNVTNDYIENGGGVHEDFVYDISLHIISALQKCQEHVQAQCFSLDFVALVGNSHWWCLQLIFHDHDETILLHSSDSARLDGLLLLCGGKFVNNFSLASVYGLAKFRDGRYGWVAKCVPMTRWGRLDEDNSSVAVLVYVAGEWCDSKSVVTSYSVVVTDEAVVDDYGVLRGGVLLVVLSKGVDYLVMVFYAEAITATCDAEEARHITGEVVFPDRDRESEGNHRAVALTAETGSASVVPVCWHLFCLEIAHHCASAALSAWAAWISYCWQRNEQSNSAMHNRQKGSISEGA
ncbi:hypothetical protein POM88_048722 [Heracleum sosnowskyi]|uniref:Uncharacterized protein n=1 Tax=Heracleum sosnowskyi TaxID=360622 RepID=A0AAD8GWW2_9APIA|nr:hypothetical protein POM88_048722 [Heracleum sosnowskyi]